MEKLSGSISDRLRAMFTTDQILNNPHPDRSASPVAHANAKTVQGVQESKPDRKNKQ